MLKKHIRKDPKINFTISIISHGHRDFVLHLLDDLGQLKRRDFEVILTWNLNSENNEIPLESYPFRINTIINATSQGFARNHNQAFQHCSGENFVILNPDIRLEGDPFDALLKVLHTSPNAICAPAIFNTHHEREDSARFFPSPLTLIKKALTQFRGGKLRPDPIPSKGQLLCPDWIAGMFMAIPERVYNILGGLSERYYLYYEDVDFCARARLRGIDVLVDESVKAIHDARRESHRNFRFLTWHLRSALRFFTSPAYLYLCMKRK